MRGQPHWFGPDRATFGLVHWPRAPRAAVVICPPPGYEGISAHAALCRLAESLSERGIAALMVSPPTSGNSLRIGLGDDVAEWKHAIGAAVAELRSTGIDRIGLMGLRFSATVVGEIASTLRADALALWDPVQSGRRYIRALRLLAAEADDGVVAAGVRFGNGTLSAMSRMSLDLGEISTPALVIERAETSSDTKVAVSSDAPVKVERLSGTVALLETDAELAVVPMPIIERITEWFDVLFDRSRAESVKSPTFCATTSQTIESVPLVHEALRVGPIGLFTIITCKAAQRPRRAVIFLNNGVSPSVGPGGAWVDWAAEVAGAGHLAVRLDFDGVGDSPARQGTVDNDSYPAGAAEDVSDVVDILRERGVERVALVGLCSGALLSFDAALRRPEIDRIVAINPRFDKPYRDRSNREVRAGGQTNRILAIPLHKTPLLRYFESVPGPVWRLLSLLHLVPRPTLAAERVVAKGTKVTFIFGADEWGMRAMMRRSPKQFARLQTDPLVSLNVVESLDHSMFAPAGRRDVEATLRSLFAAALQGGDPSHVSNSEVVSS